MLKLCSLQACSHNTGIARGLDRSRRIHDLDRLAYDRYVSQQDCGET